jgi:3-deoxy-D-manno-octulosonic-acid transferase
MYAVYSVLLFFALLFYFPVYFVKSRLCRRESLHFRQRCGRGLKEKDPQKKSVWIHAVSVGEVLSLQNLIQEVKEMHPDWRIDFSCLTESGYRMAREKLGEADEIFFVPLDLGFIVKKFFRRLKPDVFVLAESEFWPHLLREAKRKTNGVLLVNGRISARSFKRHKRFRFLMNRILSQVSLFLVQTERDKAMLEKIGVDPEIVRVAGNLKAEIELPLLSPQDLKDLRDSLSIPDEAKVIVAGSVRKGEEEPLLRAFLQARETKPELLFILAPRHPERAGEVEKICQRYPFQVRMRTAVQTGTKWDILILDTLGELARIYALSDIAFVGGSLVPWGGHNLLEPAFYAKPVFFGPHMDNFAHLAEIFVEAGAARILKEQGGLASAFSLKDEDEYIEMGRKAKSTLQSLQGATKKSLRALESLMDGNKKTKLFEEE